MIRKKEANVENRILVVDDEKLWRDLLKEELEGENYSVEVAATYPEAQAKLRQAFNQGQPFYLVTVDIDMPGPGLVRGGESLLELLSREYPGTKRVIVSGAKLLEEELRRYYQYEVRRFFFKGDFQDKDKGQQMIKDFRQAAHSLARESKDEVITESIRNPYTGLPGEMLVEDQLRQLIQHREDNQWTLFDITVENVQSLEKVCGWQHSAAALRGIAQILNVAVDEQGTPLDFIGHIGISNFIIITRSSHGEKIRAKIEKEFGKTVVAFYPHPKKDKDEKIMKDADGNIAIRLSTGDKCAIPLMELKIRTISGDKDGPFSDIREIIEYGRATK